MFLIIAGRPRSGTTILQTLCDRHPEVSMTNEFGSLMYLEQSFTRHALNMFKRLQRVQGKWAFDHAYYTNQSDELARLNKRFAMNYLRQLRWQTWGKVTAVAVEATYRQLFPSAKVIGDKLPHYLLHMKTLTAQQNLKRLVIYRDCRDVTSSFLHQVRTTWKGADWVHQFDTAEKIAASWVRDIQIMESHADKLMILQYERLMQQPEQELARLSSWLDIDPQGFPTELLRADSIGKYRQGLTTAEIDAVLTIASPTLLRLGYEL